MEKIIKEHLCRVYGLNMQDVNELFALGQQTVSDCLRVLDVAWQGNMTAFGDTVHTLKGALFNMGQGDLGERARALEMAAKAGNLGKIKKDYMSFRNDVVRILA